jgi:hypothetical protein
MTQDTYARATNRLRILQTELAQKRSEVEGIITEMERIQAALEILRPFAPPGMAEDMAAYGDLKSLTVPEGCARILQVRRDGLTARELMQILEKAGKLQEDNPNNQIGVIGALNRHAELFKKTGKTWTLVDSNGHLPFAEVPGHSVGRS